MDFKTQEINLARSMQAQKQKKNWRIIVFGRRFAVILMLLLQFAFFFFLSWEGSRLFAILHSALMACGILLSLFIIRGKASSGYKLLWVFFILAMPIFGVTFYFLIRGQGSTKKMRRLSKKVDVQRIEALQTIGKSCQQGEKIALGAYERLASYLQMHGGFSVSAHDKITYYKTGEIGFAALLHDIEAAKKYIFLEYFIVDEGVLWNRILDALLRKVAEGVEVRLMMDDMGCFMLKPRHFARDMEKSGIKVCIFNRFRPFITAIQNNRDHRKIAVIDGHIAHTGGANIADEYVNMRRRFGYWKDTMVRTEGPAAAEFAVMFLSLWDVAMQKDEAWDAYMPSFDAPLPKSDTYVLPFSESPHDKEPCCRNVFLSLIQNAQKSLYICTPYLMPDETLLDALVLAASSGVDVRIIVPYLADKKLVKMTGRTYFGELISAGVRIYEYTPGFNHAKMMIADGKFGYVGSANFDYRSLFMHYECGLLAFGGEMTGMLAKDFEEIFASSAEVAAPERRFNYLHSLWDQLLRLLAPLM